MPSSQNTSLRHTASAPGAAEASSTQVNDTATSPSSLTQRTCDSRSRAAQTMSSSSSSRHHVRRLERISPAELTMLTAAAAARRTNAENVRRTTTTPSPPTISRPPRYMMLTAARLTDAENAGRTTTTTTTRAGTSGGAAQPVTDASRDTYDSFADEYWYHVRNAALRGQQDRARQQRRRPAAEEEEEEEGHGSETRRAYVGLTNILHRLRSSTPEPKSSG